MVNLTPVDYLSALGGLKNLPNPATDMAVAQKLQSDQASVAEQNAKAQALLDAAAQERQRKADYTRFLTNPNPKVSDYSDLILKYPKDTDAIKKSFDLRDEAARTGDLRHLSDIYGWLRAEKPENAINSLQMRMRQEQEKTGAIDEDDQMVLDLIKSNPKGARNFIGMTLARVGGVDKFASAFGDITKAETEDAQRPAKTAILQAEANSAPTYFKERARKQAADADIADTDSAWRAAKNSAGVNLTKAQTKNLFSLIAERGKETGKGGGKVTVADVMTPIYEKVSKGEQLSQGEFTAWSAYTRAPKGVRTQPTVAGGPPSRITAPARPTQGKFDAPVAVNHKTGERVQWNGKAWVPAR